jgi:DNA-binding NarL/FixJ family response regulator
LKSKAGRIDDKVTIFLADDHCIVREGIRLLISRDPRFRIIGEAEDGRSALEKIEQKRPQIAVLDISMPKLTGLDVARELKKSRPDTRIILLTQYDNDEYISEALKIGIEGYILKQDVSEALVKAIGIVIQGHNYLSPQITTMILDDYRKMSGSSLDAALSNIETPYNKLTAREREVLKLVSEGRKNREIASLLFISDQTVKVHRKNIMRKLNMRNISDLVRYAIKHGLVE